MKGSVLCEKMKKFGIVMQKFPMVGETAGKYENNRNH